MNDSMLFWDRLKKKQLIIPLAPENAEDCVNAYVTLHPLGVALQIDLNKPEALEGIQVVKQIYPYAHILAGRVMTHHQADLVIDAGVSGVVSFDYIPIVAEVCARRDVLYIPGGISDVGKHLAHKAALYNCEPNELCIHHPYQWIYMLFPALTGGTGHLEMVPIWKSVYPDLLMVYAGGICEENVKEIVKRDSRGIICAPSYPYSIGDSDRLRQYAEKWLALIHDQQAKLWDETAESASEEAAVYQEVTAPIQQAAPQYVAAPVEAAALAEVPVPVEAAPAEIAAPPQEVLPEVALAPSADEAAPHHAQPPAEAPLPQESMVSQDEMITQVNFGDLHSPGVAALMDDEELSRNWVTLQ